MQVENWYPFVTLSSIFDQNTAVNAGFAVDRWTPQSRPGKEAVTGKTIQGLLSGLVVDLAVRDIDAILHRGAAKADALSAPVLAEVKRIVGFLKL
jgi:hypothetical protein